MLLHTSKLATSETNGKQSQLPSMLDVFGWTRLHQKTSGTFGKIIVIHFPCRTHVVPAADIHK